MGEKKHLTCEVLRMKKEELNPYRTMSSSFEGQDDMDA